MYKKYLEKIMENTEELSQAEICEVIDDYSAIMEKIMDKIKVLDNDLYNEAEIALYEMANGKVLTKDMAEKWVNSMQPYGEHWDISEVEDAMRRNNLDYDLATFYVLMNMYYNDFYNTFKDETTTYIKMARDKMEDVDGVDNWIYKEFKIDMDME